MLAVSEGNEGWFIAAFLAQYIIGSALLASSYWWQHPWCLTGLAAAGFIAPLIIIAAAHSILLVEGYSMVAERYKKRQRAEGREEGRAEGKAEAADEYLEAFAQRQEGESLSEAVERLRREKAAQR